jgi:hypothetical protein
MSEKINRRSRNDGHRYRQQFVCQQPKFNSLLLPSLSSQSAEPERALHESRRALYPLYAPADQCHGNRRSAIVKVGNPTASINGTASAVMKPPPRMGRVMICR